VVPRNSKPQPVLDALLRRDRAVVGAGLASVTLVAWLYLLHVAHDMPVDDMAAMPGMAMTTAWTARDAALTFAMWAAMMVGMMLPTAAPMTLLFATINRRRVESGPAPVPTGVFVGGYLAVWTAFSAAAALGQWGLQRAALLSTETLAVVPLAGGTLLVAAGAYQLTPLKYACLSRCRSPLAFIMNEWREGLRGAFVMGLRHGMACVGCCWALMALLFVAGVMNLLWVAAIAAFVLVEKIAPAGRVLSVASGALLVAWGIWVAARSF
jgi:predicted metal-binding membrane protein